MEIMRRFLQKLLLPASVSVICIFNPAALAASTNVYELEPATNALEKSSRQQIARYRVIRKKHADVIDIVSDHWHGGGIKVRLKKGKWPGKLFIHLRTSESDAYAMLERLSLLTSSMRVSSSYRRRYRSVQMQKYNPVNGKWTGFSKVRVPMTYKKTHMRIQVPREILVNNPKELKIAWIYMYSLH